MSRSRRFLRAFLSEPGWSTLASIRQQLRTEWSLSRSHRRGLATLRAYPPSLPLQLHLACGSNHKPGWLNIDCYRRPPCVPDITLDLRRSLPFADNSCSRIYSEHFFEHVAFPDSAAGMLNDWMRVLQPGGELAIGVPDPAPVLAAYLKDQVHPYFEYFLGHPSVRRHLGTKMEAINWLFRQGGEHHFIYDFQSLQLMLQRAGFVGIVRREFDPSRDAECRHNGTLYIDAVKPR